MAVERREDNDGRLLEVRVSGKLRKESHEEFDVRRFEDIVA